MYNKDVLADAGRASYVAGTRNAQLPSVVVTLMARVVSSLIHNGDDVHQIKMTMKNSFLRLNGFLSDNEAIQHKILVKSLSMMAQCCEYSGIQNIQSCICSCTFKQ